VKITSREKRFLIAGAVLAIAVLAFYLSPLILPQDLSASVEAKKTLLQRQKEMIAQEDSIKARIAAGEQRWNNDMRRLLPGETAGSASGALMKILQDLADASQVELTRKTPQPEQKFQENLTKVTVQLETNCNLDQLVRFLAAIQNYEKYLKVDELFIQAYRFQKKDEIRNPSMRVSGYVATAAPDAKPAEKGPGK
jgi:hypothetical protein